MKKMQNKYMQFTVHRIQKCWLYTSGNYGLMSKVHHKA